MAVRNGGANIIQAFLFYPGVDVNLADEHYGYTPLLEAIQSRNNDAVSLLLCYGAYLPSDSSYATTLDFSQGAHSLGITDLMLATGRGQIEQVKKLLINGANLFAVNKLNHTVLNIVNIILRRTKLSEEKRKCYIEIACILERAMLGTISVTGEKRLSLFGWLPNEVKCMILSFIIGQALLYK